MMSYFIAIGVVLRVLLPAWLMDRLFGDPVSLPHPVIWFGKMITFGEKRLNKGSYKLWKGGIMSVLLILFVYSVTIGIEYALSFLGTPAVIGFDIICIFFCLAGTTLIKEVRMVFEAVDRSLEEGRIQVARIVGRDTSELSAQEVRTAALETLAENLSDGVIAPLFWYLLLGVPGMMAYKMVNTLDSMIGYHSDRYLLFGRVAARVDDVANYIPARLTAFLMVLASGRLKLLSFVKRKRLTELRHQRNLTQVEVGKAINVSSSLISAYEIGGRTPTLTILVKLARFYHVTTDYLLGCESKSQLSLDGLSPKDKEAVETIIKSLKNSVGHH